jgi:hypothetical protein
MSLYFLVPPYLLAMVPLLGRAPKRVFLLATNSLSAESDSDVSAQLLSPPLLGPVLERQNRLIGRSPWWCARVTLTMHPEEKEPTLTASWGSEDGLVPLVCRT